MNKNKSMPDILFFSYQMSIVLLFTFTNTNVMLDLKLVLQTWYTINSNLRVSSS